MNDVNACLRGRTSCKCRGEEQHPERPRVRARTKLSESTIERTVAGKSEARVFDRYSSVDLCPTDTARCSAVSPLLSFASDLPQWLTGTGLSTQVGVGASSMRSCRT